ncbi:MAG: type II toxin-antitoxin system RelE family toxin [Acidimicrobiales bacterium]
MTDRFEIEFSSSARRQLQQLPSRVAAAILEFITVVLPDNPLRLSKPLSGNLTGLRSARRGDYRVLFWIDESSSTVIIVRIAHRADAYLSRPR